jgi:hypothetical protein
MLLSFSNLHALCKLKNKTLLFTKKTILRTFIFSIFLFIFYQLIYFNQEINFSYFDYFKVVYVSVFDVLGLNYNPNRFLFLYFCFMIISDLLTIIILDLKNIKNHYLFKYIKNI